MRKKYQFIIAALTLSAFFLVGCGNNNATTANTEAVTTVTEETTENAADSVTGATTSSEDFTVYLDDEGRKVVKHKYGETIIPENPERIVSIKLEDILVALEVEMVASRNFDDFYLHDILVEMGVPEIAVDEEAGTVNLEQVLSYQPDLIIIRDSFDQTVYDELSKIAPTIAFDLKNPETALLSVGRALDIEEKAEERLKEYKDFLADAKAQLEEAVSGESVAMLRILKKEVRLYPYSTNDMSSFLYAGIGLTADPLVIAYDDNSSNAISMEMLPDLTADHIFLIAGYGSSTAEDIAAAKERYDEIQADPLWQTIPAVQNATIYEVDSRTWLNHGIICTELKVQEVLDYLVQ